MLASQCFSQLLLRLEPYPITGEARIRFPLTTGTFGRYVRRVRHNATNIHVFLRAKEHLKTAGEAADRNVVNLTSQLKTGTKVR